jgi:hypothetical protein
MSFRQAAEVIRSDVPGVDVPGVDVTGVDVAGFPAGEDVAAATVSRAR